MFQRLLLIIGFLIVPSARLGGQEIDFWETFALAPDRGAVLEQLIPGTEEHYFFSCLHAEQQRDFDEVERLLTAWIKQHGETAQARQIRTREMLLQYDAHPEQTLEYLRRVLGLRFDHKPQRSPRDPKLPIAMDPDVISHDRLARRAFRHKKNTSGFTEHAFDWLVTQPLNPLQRRHLLQRLERPDYPGLATLVVEDLKQKDSQGFGSLDIHAKLLKDQLDDCLERMPALRNHQAFVDVYLQKLAPQNDLDWRYDHDAAIAYLDRLWSFAKTLEPVHNSLKAQILFRRLVLDRSRGEFNKERFVQYLQLPRQVAYANKTLTQSAEWRRFAADLQYDSQGKTRLPPVGSDEPLVRSYLQHFFLTETDFDAYRPWIADRYLKSLFAETKITAGLGDVRTWYAMLRPDEVQALKDRIDLDFLPTNQSQFGVEDEVKLELDIKNIDKLIVRVFRINTENYYRQTGRPVNTDIELDGLVPNEELAFEYDEPSERRVRRTFTFPQLDRRGVYVIDFIGNGVSSRAVIRKGTLRYLTRTHAAGQVFTILDESHQQVTGATLWVADREYSAEPDGRIVIPFSTQPGPATLVIVHEGFAALHKFEHQAENYRLQSAFYVDRESLLKHREAPILVRPRLLLNGTPIGLDVLEEISLKVTSTDHEGTQTTQVIDDFELFPDRESTHTIQVPARLRHLLVELRGRVEQLSTGKQLPLTASQQFGINQIEQQPRTDDLHFIRTKDRYVIEVLGRSGEPRARQVIQCELKHRDFTETVRVQLQSNDRGQLDLGPLENILWVQASLADGYRHQWWLPKDQVAHAPILHGVAGETLKVPYTGREAGRENVSLLRMAGGTPVADAFAQTRLRGGMLELHGLTPGNYSLVLKESQTAIKIRITAGVTRHQHALGKTRYLEIRRDRPLHIATTSVRQGKLRVKLLDAGPQARVHVLATRYQPAFPPFTALASIRDISPQMVRLHPLLAQYVAGRDIGDEYRYVLERKYAEKLPGNLLQRPSLLLNPWAIRDTSTGRQSAAEGDAFAASATPDSSMPSARMLGEADEAGWDDAANLDFLSDASAVFLNLRPDEAGLVEVDVSELGQQQLHVIAVDDTDTSYRQLALPLEELAHDDLRLIQGLDPAKHYAQRKQVSVVKTGEPFVIPDVTSAQFDYYDSLSRMHQLFTTLSADAHLADFAFVTEWPTLSDEKKQELYSKFACHELHYFLFRKDPKFFKQTIFPYLANKKDKTFLDRWLLEEPTETFLSPWDHARLNIAERVLLGRRIAHREADMQRHIQDLFDATPRNVAHLNLLFSTAIRGRALETSASGRGGAVREAEEKAVDLFRSQAATALPSLSQAKQQNVREGADLDDRQAGETVAGTRLGRGLADEPSRERYRRLYLPPEKTKEWVENNYYRLPLQDQPEQRVRINAFWNDFARLGNASPFVSAHWAEASGNFTEMMLALGACDLPFEAKEHRREFDQGKLTLTAASPMVVFHQQIEEIKAGDKADQVLVSQTFYRHDDRYEVVAGTRRQKTVAEEFLVDTVYGCQVVVTNPTSASLKADVLLQVPQGAIPVGGSHYTRAVTTDLGPYSSQSLEYLFYFPASGDYDHFPVHVGQDGDLVGYTKGTRLHVVDELSKTDTQSWDYVSQFAPPEEVLKFLETHNVHDLLLERIAFRMTDPKFFDKTLKLLRERHAYSDVLWSYSLRHRDVVAANEFLAHATSLIQCTGPSLTSRLLTVEPIPRGTYQHREYWPLVNARAHTLGRKRQILNDRFHTQYHEFMRVLGYQPKLSAMDQLAVVHYLLLQDRVPQARELFAGVDRGDVSSQLQYDYLAAYLDCFNRDPQQAAAIVAGYKDYPVDRWRERFDAVSKLLDELAGHRAASSDDKHPSQDHLAESEPAMEVTLNGSRLEIRHRNLKQAQVNYYLMDLELLFSRNPFVTEFAGQFSHIFPNQTQSLSLDPNNERTTVELPEALQRKNVLVEVQSSAGTESRSYYANALVVDMMDRYGQLRVRLRETHQPLAAVYVKTYAEMKDGSVVFYKDGYTDLVGKFDYSSLSTDQLDQVKRFAILVLSDDHGAIVREASPPSR